MSREVLTLRSANTVLATHVEPCFKMLKRMRGLLGRNTLPQGHCVWLKPCNNIHTFFMKFNIDALFVDRQLRVVRVYCDLPPGRLIWAGVQAHSVFEFAAGSLKPDQLLAGEQLLCGS